MITENPFRYGVVVDDPYFINREKEVKEIGFDLISGNNLIITSPRRYGKTSLVMKVINQLEKQGFPVIYLDFFRISDLKQFMDTYASQILRKQTGIKKSLAVFQKWIHGIRPAITLDPSGSRSFTFSHDPAVPVYDSLTEILNLPLKINSDKRWIVVFDEFQDIEKLNGQETEKWFRSVMQFHEQISYVFLGSKTHLIGQMFSQRERAFYGFGKLMRIGKIPCIEMEHYISNRMNQTGINCDQASANQIISLADNIPYFVQFLASETWSLARENNGIINDMLITRAVENILNNQQDHFHQLIDQLSPYQKKVVRALTSEQDQIYSQNFMKKYDLGAVSSTQRAVESLTNSGILEKDQEAVYFSNPFFRQYLKDRA
ncbi:MAG TPA: ATP-binding protein [Bacteroidales bacterium]|nr:ATP-binding protein [Bacteroidales bacterium]HPI85108.1 ATP-binding protein [Bacteroidales bacterium]HPM91722.1 ATP-binding protein [Bacteroidales bacterium]